MFLSDWHMYQLPQSWLRFSHRLQGTKPQGLRWYLDWAGTARRWRWLRQWSPFQWSWQLLLLEVRFSSPHHSWPLSPPQETSNQSIYLWSGSSFVLRLSMSHLWAMVSCLGNTYLSQQLLRMANMSLVCWPITCPISYFRSMLQLGRACESLRQRLPAKPCQLWEFNGWTQGMVVWLDW